MGAVLQRFDSLKTGGLSILLTAREGGAVGLGDTYNLDRVSRKGSTNDKALSAGVSRGAAVGLVARCM